MNTFRTSGLTNKDLADPRDLGDLRGFQILGFAQTAFYDWDSGIKSPKNYKIIELISFEINTRFPVIKWPFWRANPVLRLLRIWRSGRIPRSGRFGRGVESGVCTNGVL